MRLRRVDPVENGLQLALQGNWVSRMRSWPGYGGSIEITMA